MASQLPQDVDLLLHGYVNQTLDEPSLSRLHSLLHGSREAVLRYVEFLHLEIALSEWARSEGDPPISTIINDMYLEDALDSNRKDDPPATAIPILPSGSPKTPSSNPINFFSWQVWLPLTLVALIALFFVTRKGDEDPNDRAPMVAENEPEVSPEETEAPTSNKFAYNMLDNRFAARIINISEDAVWADGKSPQDFLVRLNPNESLELLSGMAEIESGSGARLLLQGHTKYTSISRTEGRLELGKMSARAENGNFSVITPTAKIVDLGTEFLVAVDDSQVTQVATLEGEVTVQGIGIVAAEAVEHLEIGDSAEVAVGGAVNSQVTIDTTKFERILPTSSTGENRQDSVSLVSILCRGSLVGAINPLTGKADDNLLKDGRGAGEYVSDGSYHRAEYHPAIDGTFVVDKSGKNNQVDSAGNQYSDFSETEGLTYGSIWAKRNNSRLPEATRGNFWEEGSRKYIQNRLKKSTDGLVGMHANVGVTIDLAKLSDDPKLRPAVFRTTVANLDCMRNLRPKEFSRRTPPTASFWVLVDGKYRNGRLNFARDHDGITLSVPIHETDRYLTLVTTDASGSSLFDFVVLVDPTIDLIQK